MWWWQFEAPVLLFVLTSLILSYYSGLALQCSAENRTGICIIAITEYVFMADAMLVINGRDRACPRYYTLNTQLSRLGGRRVILPFQQGSGRTEFLWLVHVRLLYVL